MQNDLSFKVPVTTPRKNYEMLNEHEEQSNNLDLKCENNNSKQPNKFEVEESTYSDYCSDSNNVPFCSTTPSGTLQRKTQNNVSNRRTYEVTYVNGIELASTLNDPYYESFQVQNAAMLASHPQKKPLPTPRKSFPNEKLTKEHQNDYGVFPRKCNWKSHFMMKYLNQKKKTTLIKKEILLPVPHKFMRVPI